MHVPSCNRAHSGRNNIPLLTHIDGEPVTHFTLREFENREGLAMVHRATLEALERVRRDLAIIAGEAVYVIITGAVRTRADLERLGARHGWTDEGGLVSRNSKHLAEFGGIAVDLVARSAISRRPIPQATLGKVCRRYFDFVKDDYSGGHVHADLRGLL